MADPTHPCPYSYGAAAIKGCQTIRDTGRTLAAVTANFTAANADVTYTAKAALRDPANNITVAHVVLTDEEDAPIINTILAVDVAGRAITVTLATDAEGAVTTTANEIKTAIEADAEAAALVTVTVEGAGTGLANALDTVTTTGGVYAGCPCFVSSQERCGRFTNI